MRHLREVTLARVSAKSLRFTESVIREMTRLARAHDAINLAQGFPDFEAPDVVKEAACAAIRGGVNQYAITWGAVLLSPMVPFEPDSMPDLSGTDVFIGAGRADPIAPPAQVERLMEMLEACGATVTVSWDPGGHRISPALVTAAREWLVALATGPRSAAGP